jgi:hypothetical protein
MLPFEHVRSMGGGSVSPVFSSWGLHLTKLRHTFVAKLEGLELATFFKIWEIGPFFLTCATDF